MINQPSFNFDGQDRGHDQGSVTAERGNWREEVDAAASDRRCRPHVSSVVSVWQEIPQARFLSWSEEMQRAYCAARDDASALTAHERGEDPEFYRNRASVYRGVGV